MTECRNSRSIDGDKDVACHDVEYLIGAIGKGDCPVTMKCDDPLGIGSVVQASVNRARSREGGVRSIRNETQLYLLRPNSTRLRRDAKPG